VYSSVVILITQERLTADQYPKIQWSRVRL